MKNPTINQLFDKFENIKNEVNEGKLALFAQFETEDLLETVQRIRAEYILLKKDSESIESLEQLIHEILEYLDFLMDEVEHSRIIGG